MKRPVCPECCKHPRTGRWPELGEEVSGYRTCPVCSNKYNDKLQIVTRHKTTQEKELYDSEGENPGGYLSSIAQKWIEHSMRGFFLEKRLRTSEEIQDMIYNLAEIFDTNPGRIRIIYHRTRTKGYGYTDNPRPL